MKVVLLLVLGVYLVIILSLLIALSLLSQNNK